MLSAKVGIDFVISDEKVRASMRGLSQFVVNEAGRIMNAVASSEKGAASAAEGATAAARSRAKAALNESVDAHRIAAERIAANEQKMTALRTQYEHDSGEKIIAEIKRIQDAKAAAAAAMKTTTEREVKAEEKIVIDGYEAELKMLKQIAMEKEKVLHAGAGAKAGIMGQHRDVTPTEGAGEKRSGFGMANLAGGLMIVQQGLHAAERFIEKGKGVLEVQEKLKMGFASAGVAEEQMNSKLKEVTATTAQLSEKYAQSKRDINEGTAAFLNAGGPINNLKQSQEDIIGLAKRAGISYEMAGKMLAKSTDPEVEAQMKKVGIVFDKNATAAQRQAEIHKQLAGNMKQIEEQANGPLGQMKKAEMAMSSIQSVIGSALMDIIGPILPLITEIVVKASGLIKSLIGPIGSIVKSTLTPLVSAINSIIQPVIGALSKILPPLAAIIGKLAGTLGNALTRIFSVTIKAMLPILGILTNLLGTLLDALSPVIDTVAMLVEALMPLVGTILQLFAQVLGSVLEALAPILPPIAQLLNALLMPLIPIIKVVADVIAFLANILSTVLGAVLGVVIGIIAKLVELIAGGLTAAIQWLTGAVQSVSDWFKGLYERLQPVIAMLAEKLQPAIDAITTAWNWLKGAMQSAAEWLEGAFMKVWGGILKAINWVSGAVATFIGWISKLYHWIVDNVTAAARWVVSTLGLQKAFNGVISTVNAVIEKVKAAYDWIKKLISGEDEAEKKAPRPQAPKPAALPAKPEEKKPEEKKDDGLAGKDAERATKAREKGEKQAAKDREQALKEAYERGIKAAQKALSDENAEIERALLAREITETQAAIRRAEAQNRFATAALSVAKRVYGAQAKEIITYQNELTKSLREIDKAKFEDEKATQEKAFSHQMDALEDRIQNEEMLESQAKRLRAQAQLAYYRQQLETAKRYGQETAALEKSIRDAERAARADDLKALEAYDAEVAKQEKEARKARVDAMADGDEKAKAQAELARQDAEEAEYQHYEHMLELAADNAALVEDAERRHRQRMEEIETSYQARINESAKKGAEERGKIAVDEMNKVYTLTIDADMRIQEERDRARSDNDRQLVKDRQNAKDEAVRDLLRQRQKIMTEQTDVTKRNQMLVKLQLDHAQKLNDKLADLQIKHDEKTVDIQKQYDDRKFSEGAKSGARMFLLQKAGLDQGMKHLIMVKATEVAVWIASEFQKTAATESNVFKRVALVAVEAWEIIKGAAVKAWDAVTSAIEWVFSLVPFPWSIGVAAGAATAVWGAFEGAKALFGGYKFREGAIVDRPIFGSMINGRPTMAGESGAEAILPIERLPGLLGLDTSSNAANGVASLVGALHQEVRGLRAAYESGSVAILDQNRFDISKATNDRKRANAKL